MLDHNPTTFSYEGAAITAIPLCCMAMYVDYGHVSVVQNNCWWQLASRKSRTYTDIKEQGLLHAGPRDNTFVCLHCCSVFFFAFNFQMQQVYDTDCFRTKLRCICVPKYVRKYEAFLLLVALLVDFCDVGATRQSVYCRRATARALFDNPCVPCVFSSGIFFYISLFAL